MSVHSVGWWRLIMLLMRLFHPSDTLFVQFPSVKVVSWTFHKTGWNRAGVWHVRCPLLPTGRETPSTYVSAKYCSSERPSSGAIDFSQDSPVSETQWLNFSPCRLGQVVETIIPVGLNYSARHQYKLHEWRVDSCKRTSRLQKTATNIRHFEFGVNGCLIYRFRFYCNPVSGGAVFTRCLFNNFLFYPLPILPLPFLPVA